MKKIESFMSIGLSLLLFFAASYSVTVVWNAALPDRQIGFGEAAALVFLFLMYTVFKKI